MSENVVMHEHGHQTQAHPVKSGDPKFKLLSNAKLVNCIPEEIELDVLPAPSVGKWGRVVHGVRLLRSLKRYDALIVFNADIDDAILAFVAKRILRRETSIIFFDALLQRPVGLKGICKSRIKRALFAGVDRFFCVHKDTSGYQRYYGIDAAKFVYIPFKANNFHDRLKYKSGDEGYVLACGASLRDYRTFVEAADRMKVPAKIMLPKKNAAEFHNTDLDEARLPSCVEVIRHDFDKHSWNQIMANARVVVIPIQGSAIQAAGISASLEAMAIGKPVVITEGVSTRGMLTGAEAEIVPAEDPVSMYRAIRKLWDDAGYRERLAKAGQDYAVSLGGVERMAKDILQNTCACVRERSHTKSTNK